MNEIPHPGFDKPEEYETSTTANGFEEAAGKRLRGVCNLAEETKEDRPLEERLQELKEIREKKDLEEAVTNYIAPIENEDGLRVINFSGQDIKDAFIAGAKWQKEQMIKDGTVILTEEDFDAEKEKSMEWGYNLCKEQMMKKAVECELVCLKDRLLAVLPTKDFMWTVGDKVRIIIVKENLNP